MDYCSACRRHLNGALVCPGCGVCASPDLAPMPVRTSAYAVRQPGEEDAPSAASRRGRSVPPPAAPRPHSQSPAEVPAGTGRAARRREQTRWRKSRRRAVLATAVALVGGGLTFAALNHQPTDHTRTTAAQGERPMGGTGPEATAGLPAPTPSPTHGSATPSSPPHTGAKHAAPSAPRSKAPTAPRTASPEPSKPSKPSRSASPSVLPHSRSLLPLPHSTAPAPDSATPTSPLAPTEQSPTPTQSTPIPDTTTESPSTTPSTTAPSQSPSPTASPTPSTSPSPSHLCLLVLCLN